MSAGPARIIVIRHAEKPADGANGVREDGSPDPESLMPRGWQRAGALIAFFADGQAQGDRLSPDAVFAAGVGAGSKSRRSIETVTPLVAKLRERGDLPFVTSHLKGDHQPLADDVATRQGVVLIAWEHKQIPAIAELLAPGAQTPLEWDDARFDLLWILDRTDAGWTFEKRPQALLAGDIN